MASCGTGYRFTFNCYQISSRFPWPQVLVILLLALIINTYLVEELQATFNETLPLLSVHVSRKIGWLISLAASGAAIGSSICFITTYFILARWTNVDHENLTNEEVEWKEMLNRKKKVSYKTALGNKIEWANQVKTNKNNNIFMFIILLTSGEIQEGEDQRVDLGSSDSSLLVRLCGRCRRELPS